MWPLELLRDAAWRPLTWTLLHFLWQGAVVAVVCAVLFRLVQSRRMQIHYLVGLAGLFAMAACPVVTFVLLQSAADQTVPPRAIHVAATADRSGQAHAGVPSVPLLDTSSAAEGRHTVPRNSEHYYDLVRWIGDAQPYLLAGWIAGLALLGGRLLLAAVGVRWLARGRRPVPAEIVQRAAALARRMGLAKIPGVFASAAAREAVVVGLLRPMVLLPVAWLVEMSPEVLEAVIAHELAHIRRFDLWFNLFQRLVETLLFYHPAVWWLSRRVRLLREMCCDELAARTTGDCVTYATALELAARQRLAPAGSLLQVALGVTRMTLLERVRNVLGLGPLHKRRRWWVAAALVLLVAAATGLTWLAVTYGKYTASAFLRINMQEQPIVSQAGAPAFDRERFEIFKDTQQQLLLGKPVLLAALRRPEVAKLADVQQQSRAGDAADWLRRRLSVTFPGKAELMEVSVTTYDAHEAVVLVNAVIDAYWTDVVKADRDQKQERLNKLESACAEKAVQIRNTRTELKNLTKSYGIGAGSEALTQRQKLIVDEYGLCRQNLARLEFELGELSSQVAEKNFLLKNAETIDVDDPEVDALVQKDHLAQRLLRELDDRQMKLFMAGNGGAPRRRAAVPLPKSKPQLQLEGTPLPGTVKIAPPEGLPIPQGQSEEPFGEPMPVAPSTPPPEGHLPGLPGEPSSPAPQREPSPGPAPADKAPAPPAPQEANKPQSDAEKPPVSAAVQREIKTLQREIEIIQDEFDRRREQLVVVAKKQKRLALHADVIKLQMQYDVKQKSQYEVLEKKVEKLREETQTLGSTTVDIEMLTTDLKQLELISAELNAERERMKVEFSSSPRIIRLAPAEEPETPSW
jgi:beta-lactamase regulating signal transducer with metallopeptidase domain